MLNSYVTPLLLSAAGIICSSLAIAVYHCILLRHFVRHHAAQHSDDSTDTSHAENNVGVQEEILNKIPLFSFTTEKSDCIYHLKQNECSICLGQWEDRDVVRLLPSCKHAFHRHCIDAWFIDHANCPVCRSPITRDFELASLPLASENNNVENEQRELHVHDQDINIPRDHHYHPLVNDDVSGSGSTSTPRFQRPCRALLHAHSLSSHMRRKPRGLIMGLKRSLSLDQTSSYIAITVQRDLGEASTSSSTKGVMTSLCNYRSRWDLMRSFSQFRNSSESGRYNGILPT